MNQSGHPTDVWARLRFSTLERMAPCTCVQFRILADTASGLVLFHSTFLALKAEDTQNRSRGTVDDTIKGEVEHFGQ